MSKAKNIIYTIAASFAAGAIIGILYAPAKGEKTRKKISRLKRKFSFSSDGLDEYDKVTLQEISLALQNELAAINKKLEE